MMTFKFAKCAVAVGAIGLAGVLPSNAKAANATATATATIVGASQPVETYVTVTAFTVTVNYN